MPSKKTIEKWGFNCLGYECDSEGDVTKIWCKLCREYATLVTDIGHFKKGVAKLSSEIFVKGTNIVKKNNFSDHVKKSATHSCAVTRLSEERAKSSASIVDASSSTKDLSSSSGAPRQATLMPFIQRINDRQRSQLTRKMQLAHFTALNASSFVMYGKIALFAKSTFNVSILM